MVEETEQEGMMSGGSSDEVRASQLEHQQNYGKKERRPDGLMDAYGVRDSESIGLGELGILRWVPALIAQLA